jgi:hypothetical protein
MIKKLEGTRTAGLSCTDLSIEPNEGQSGVDVLLCSFESSNAGFFSFPERDISVLRVIIVPLQHSHKQKPASCGQ